MLIKWQRRDDKIEYFGAKIGLGGNVSQVLWETAKFCIGFWIQGFNLSYLIFLRNLFYSIALFSLHLNCLVIDQVVLDYNCELIMNQRVVKKWRTLLEYGFLLRNREGILCLWEMKINLVRGLIWVAIGLYFERFEILI